jgi:hypothetical protein
MTGIDTLDYGAGAYTGTIHIVRNVAKLRINVTRDAVFLPSDLEIDYPNIKIQALNVADRTSLFESATPGAATGVTYINYNERPARCASTVGSNGGLLDSLYLYENYRSNYIVGTNTTQVRVTIPTKSVTEGNKTAAYTYTLRSNDSYDILRNYIYTLDIKVRGQSLEPLISLNMQPWNDVNLDGSILGTYLTMRTSEIEFDENGYAEVAFCTDAQAVYVNYSEFNTYNTVQIGDEIKTVNIQPADPNLTPDYQGQVLMDKRVCTSFGFQIDPLTGIEPNSLDFSGKICIKAGNIVKCISFVGQRIYDAHFIVGDSLLGASDLFTSATVAMESGSGWLEVSTNRLYTTAASSSYSGSAVPLYLHLDENLTGNIRKGSITVLSNNVEKKIYIQQLPAIPIGRFGYEGTGDAGNFDRQLYVEQRYEYITMPTYRDPNPDIPIVPMPTDNNIYNGLGTARSITNFDENNYKTAPFFFNWQAAIYQAINYCAYKNRPASKTSVMTVNDIKWYLPSQAQLMAMWITYEVYKNMPNSNFKTDTYWSSTNNILYKREAQYLNFNYGNVGHYLRDKKYWARCVRNGSAATSMIVATATEMNIDFTKAMPTDSYTSEHKVGAINDASPANRTLYHKLKLTASDSGTKKTWEEARTICNNMGQYWRLPTQKELQAIWILKAEILAEALAKGFVNFVNFADDYYWTTTESSTHTTNAYMVYMGSTPAGDAGNTPHIVKTDKAASVRCVYELP